MCLSPHMVPCIVVFIFVSEGKKKITFKNMKCKYETQPWIVIKFLNLKSLQIFEVCGMWKKICFIYNTDIGVLE